MADCHHASHHSSQAIITNRMDISLIEEQLNDLLEVVSDSFVLITREDLASNLASSQYKQITSTFSSGMFSDILSIEFVMIKTFVDFT